MSRKFFLKFLCLATVTIGILTLIFQKQIKILLMGGILAFLLNMDAYQLEQTVLSPNQQYKAQHSTNDCGAPCHHYQIVTLKVNHWIPFLEQPEDIFVFTGFGPLRLQWLNASHLEVIYPLSINDIKVQKFHWQDVIISYKGVTPPPTTSE